MAPDTRTTSDQHDINRVTDDQAGTPQADEAYEAHVADESRLPNEDRPADHDHDQVAGSADYREFASRVPRHEAEAPAATDRLTPSNGQRLPQAAPLWEKDQADGLRARWVEAQSAFVDEPRDAVQQADQLVAELMRSLAERCSAIRQQLADQWQREDATDTEELRQAMRRYRAFFDQLLGS